MILGWPMRIKGVALVVIAGVLFGGCSRERTCDEPERYELAREGVRIDAPEDLDELQASKELTVPTASPRDPRPAGSPCLDLPPVLTSKKK